MTYFINCWRAVLQIIFFNNNSSISIEEIDGSIDYLTINNFFNFLSREFQAPIFYYKEN